MSTPSRSTAISTPARRWSRTCSTTSPSATGCGWRASTAINWARVLAQVVYYFTAAVALGAPHRPVAFTVPTGNFGDIFAGSIARAMGLPIERLVIATNQNDILHRCLTTGRLPDRGVRPRSARRWTSRSRRISSARCSRPTTATARAVAQLMDELEGRGPLRRQPGRAGGAARPLRLGPRRRGRDRATIARTLRETGELLCPHSAVGVNVAEAHLGADADGHAGHRASGEVSRCGRGRDGSAPGAAAAHGRPFERPERVTRLPNDRAALQALILDRTAWRRRLMHRLTTLPNGFRIVTEHMPGLASAASASGSMAGARHERPEENGIAHFLEHMAFKGTTRRTALQIAEEIEDVGGYINAYTSREMTAYYARVLQADVPLALDVIADIVLNPAFDAARDRGRARRHPAGDRPGAGHARRRDLRLAAGGELSRPGHRPPDPGRGRACRGHGAEATCAASSPGITGRRR
jgi:hypothetical protein